MAFFEPRAKSALLPTNTKQTTLKPGSIGVKKRPADKERPFYVDIRASGHSIYIGKYRTMRDAAEAHDQASLVVHGDKAVLNFPDKKYDLEQMRDRITRTLRYKESEKAARDDTHQSDEL